MRHHVEELLARHRAANRALQHCESGPTDSTVLITGETGTGKELIARHTQALAAFRPGVHQCKLRIDPSGLIASELFAMRRSIYWRASAKTRPF